MLSLSGFFSGSPYCGSPGAARIASWIEACNPSLRSHGPDGSSAEIGLEKASRSSRYVVSITSMAFPGPWEGPVATIATPGPGRGQGNWTSPEGRAYPPTSSEERL